jgi:hypothetical protein
VDPYPVDLAVLHRQRRQGTIFRIDDGDLPNQYRGFAPAKVAQVLDAVALLEQRSVVAADGLETSSAGM